MNKAIATWVNLTRDEIKEFQEIYKDKFNEILNNEQAIEYGTALIVFMNTVAHLQEK